ncbi:MAG: type II secretion system F family protein [Planctomycetaceae bacterium]|nr:type II secretion system F family protein [Planctomycetaceae bacterium]
MWWIFLTIYALFQSVIFWFTAIAAIAIVIYLVTSRRVANRVAMLWIIATAIKHEMPLAELVQSQGREARGRSRRLLLDLADTLQEGTTLADAIDKYRILIPEQGRLAIHLGSETGTLDESLDAALESIERRPIEVIRDYQSIMFYLSIVLCFAFGITGFIMYFIIPKFKEIFIGFGVALPEMTINLIFISDLWVNYFYLFMWIPLLLIPPVVFVTSQITKGLELPDKAYNVSGRFSILRGWGILGPISVEPVWR